MQKPGNMRLGDKDLPWSSAVKLLDMGVCMRRAWWPPLAYVRTHEREFSGDSPRYRLHEYHDQKPLKWRPSIGDQHAEDWETAQIFPEAS
jgi:hypothetical protein